MRGRNRKLFSSSSLVTVGLQSTAEQVSRRRLTVVLQWGLGWMISSTTSAPRRLLCSSSVALRGAYPGPWQPHTTSSLICYDALQTLASIQHLPAVSSSLVPVPGRSLVQRRTVRHTGVKTSLRRHSVQDNLNDCKPKYLQSLKLMSLFAPGLMAMRMRSVSRMSSGVIAGTPNRDPFFEASLTPEGLSQDQQSLYNDKVDDFNQSEHRHRAHFLDTVIRAEKQFLDKKSRLRKAFRTPAVQCRACSCTSHAFWISTRLRPRRHFGACSAPGLPPLIGPVLSEAVTCPHKGTRFEDPSKVSKILAHELCAEARSFVSIERDQ